MKMYSFATGSLALVFLFVTGTHSWNDGGSVLLRDVQVLTLYRDRYTSARRTSPVPQLRCLGGSAGCSVFIPEVVQCQNKGWDGIDVQWECRTDMDNAYRFGSMVVSCEGYSHPDDPYILKGSCGLEYTLELTGEGRHRGGGGGSSSFSGFASNFFQSSSGGNRYQQGGGGAVPHQSSVDAGGLLVVGFFLLLAYAVYKMFLCNPQHGQAHFPHADGHQGHAGPPPPGFKPGYTGPGAQYGFRSEYTGAQYPTGTYTPTAGGFWSGMGAGGLLGYMFGSRHRQPSVNFGNSGYNWDSGNSNGRKATESSGSRSASGFAGTRRR